MSEKRAAFLLVLLAVFSTSLSAAAKEYVLFSPDKTVELRVAVGPIVAYSMYQLPSFWRQAVPVRL